MYITNIINEQRNKMGKKKYIKTNTKKHRGKDKKKSYATMINEKNRQKNIAVRIENEKKIRRKNIFKSIYFDKVDAFNTILLNSILFWCGGGLISTNDVFEIIAIYIISIIFTSMAIYHRNKWEKNDEYNDDYILFSVVRFGVGTLLVSLLCIITAIVMIIDLFVENSDNSIYSWLCSILPSLGVDVYISPLILLFVYVIQTKADFIDIIRAWFTFKGRKTITFLGVCKGLLIIIPLLIVVIYTIIFIINEFTRMSRIVGILAVVWIIITGRYDFNNKFEKFKKKMFSILKISP